MSNPRMTITVPGNARVGILLHGKKHSDFVRAAGREWWVSSAAGGEGAASSMSVMRHRDGEGPTRGSPLLDLTWQHEYN